MPGPEQIARWGFPALTVILIGTTAYGITGLSRERRQTQELAAANTALRASLTEVQTELQQVSARLNDLTAQPPAQTTPQPAPPPVKQVDRQRPLARHRSNSRKVSSIGPPAPNANDTRQAIDRTREELEGKLNSMYDELSGSIAKTHDDLVALQKRGERTYYEFTIDKSKSFQKVGPLSVSLRSVNRKHKYYDLALIVDDQQLQKKHVNLYEPMMLSTSGSPQPIELVVNEIHDNMVKGYVSEPKYKKAELTASGKDKPASDQTPSLRSR
jgi:hypothetical protein